jgi:hypothetical protein
MNDAVRDNIIRKSAYGFLACVAFLFLMTMLNGRAESRWILAIIFPLYSLYYVIMYTTLCNGYQDKTKKMMAYSHGARGTLVGVIYYLSWAITALTFYMLVKIALKFLK